MEHAERLEYLDALLSRANQRRGRLTVFFNVRITASLSPRLGQRDREESRLHHEQDQREDRGGGINVQLGRPKHGLSERDRLGGKVRADGRTDAEAYGEGDAHVGEGLCAVGGRGDVGEDRAFFLSPQQMSTRVFVTDHER